MASNENDDIIQDNQFQLDPVIRAVREGRVLLVDEALVSRPTMQLLEGIETLRRLLYPNFAVRTEQP